MPDIVLAPYLPLREPVEVGPWKMEPFKALHETEALAEELRRSVTRLVEAYRLPAGGGQTLGAVLYPSGASIGSEFELRSLAPLKRALVAGVIATNPPMASAEEDSNAGHAVATAENAVVWGHPIGDGNSYVLNTGVLAQTMSYHHADPDEALPAIAPPVELPSNLFSTFDQPVADATHRVISSDSVSGRRLSRALDWYLIAFSNAEAVTLDVRVGAARSAVEVMTGAGDRSKKIVRSFGRLLRDEATPTETYRSPIWTKHGEQVPVQLTREEWWMACLCELRNAIVHGDDVPDDLWFHAGHHHINHIHDRLVDCLLATLAREVQDPLLRLRQSERVFAEMARELAEHLRNGDPESGA